MSARISVNWTKMDWTRTDTKIAKEIGASQSVVWTWRKKLGAPKATWGRTKTVPWGSLDWSKPTSQISLETGIHLSCVSQMRGRFAPETLNQHLKNYRSVDWSKSDTEIAISLGCSRSAVGNYRRMIGAPKHLRSTPESRREGQRRRMQEWKTKNVYPSRFFQMLAGASAITQSETP